MTDKSEITQLLLDCNSQDVKVASEAQRKVAKILAEPLRNSERREYFDGKEQDSIE